MAKCQKLKNAKNFQLSNFKSLEVPKLPNSKFQKTNTHRFQNIQWNSFSHLHERYVSKLFPSVFLYHFDIILKNGRLKSIKKGSQGLVNPEIMEVGGFGPSHNKTEIVLDQN